MDGIKTTTIPGRKTDGLMHKTITYCTEIIEQRIKPLNTDEVKEYFEMNNTFQGMFMVYENLLNIKIKETPGSRYGIIKMKTYEMWKELEKITGNFYLDLFRPSNKTPPLRLLSPSPSTGLPE